MDTLRDLLARERRSDAPALRHGGRAYDYRRLCTTAWKVGNLLRNEGVRGGRSVAVAADPAPEPVLTFLGASLLGAVVRFDPPESVEAAALVVPADRIGAHDPAPGTRVVAYGAEPADPAVAYFERDVWSENPTVPPDRPGPDDPALAADGREFTHGDLLDAAETVVERWELAADETVTVRAPLTEPGTVAAGVVAPLLAGAELLLPDGGATGDCAVTDGDAPEPRWVAPGDVLG